MDLVARKELVVHFPLLITQSILQEELIMARTPLILGNLTLVRAKKTNGFALVKLRTIVATTTTTTTT